jgi:co-chaperonin GroES (HSP10)
MTATVAPALESRAHIRPIGTQVVLVAVNAPVVEELRTDVVSMNVRISAGGVALPDTIDNEAMTFEIVGLGDGYEEGCPKCEPGGRRHVFEVAIGDRVLLCPWDATTVTVDGTDFWICSERAVLGIFDA